MSVRTIPLYSNAIARFYRDPVDEVYSELTIMRPAHTKDAHYHPAESVTIYGHAIQELLNFLRDVYENPEY